MRQKQKTPEQNSSYSQPVTLDEFDEIPSVSESPIDKHKSSPSKKKSEHSDEHTSSPSKKKSEHSDEHTSSPSKKKSELSDVQKPGEKTTNAIVEKSEWDPEVFEGMNVLGTMSSEHVTELLDNIDKQSPAIDRKKFKTRLTLIDWERVAFATFGPRECRLAWAFLMTTTRKYRIMSEIVHEVRLATKTPKKKVTFLSTFKGFPTKPIQALGARQCYARELWEKHTKDAAAHGETKMNFVQFQAQCNLDFTKLSDVKKDRYQKIFEKASAEYHQRVKEFHDRFPGFKPDKKPMAKPKPNPEKYPDAPQIPQNAQAYFMKSNLDKLTGEFTPDELAKSKADLLEKWKVLSNRKRAKWIDKAINACEIFTKELEEFQRLNPQYVPKADIKIKSLITKADLELWENYRGKPVKPHLSILNLFAAEFLKKEENALLPFDRKRQIADQAFKDLDWYEKEMYKLNFKSMLVQYKRDINKYFENLPNVVKPLVIETIPKKYRSAALDVAVCLPSMIDEENGDKDEEIDFDDSRKSKKKKSKKRKHDNESVPEEIFPDYPVTIPDEGEEAELSPSKSKKKKKKKDRERGSSQEVEINTQEELITEDTDGGDTKLANLKITFKKETTPVRDSQGEDQQRSLTHKKINLKNLSGESPEKPILSSKTIAEKPKPNRFTANKVSQKDIDDAIRGIFDGRSHLGRRYSVYYFYAKYVCQDKVWIRYTDAFGVFDTADRIVKTFVELSDHHKEIFLTQSYNFFLQKEHGIKLQGIEQTYTPGVAGDVFPGEPIPPPRNACKLYEKEVNYLTRKKVNINFPKWEDLHVETQSVFIKKLYKETQMYIKKFEEFVMMMSPNDLVEYIVWKHRGWERKQLTFHTAKHAVKGFIFPLPPNEFKEDGQESGSEVIDTGNKRGTYAYRTKKEVILEQNPFSKHRLQSGRGDPEKNTGYPFYKPILEKGWGDAENTSVGDSNKEPEEAEDVSPNAGDNEVLSSDEELTKKPRQYDKDKYNKKKYHEIREFFYPMGVLTKRLPPPLKMRKKNLTLRSINRIRASAALAKTNRSKRWKPKKKQDQPPTQPPQVSPPLAQIAKTLEIRGKKAKVMLPKKKVTRRKDDAGAVNDLVELLEIEENADEDAPSCSQFLQSLRTPPKKRAETTVVDEESETRTEDVCVASASDEIQEIDHFLLTSDVGTDFNVDDDGGPLQENIVHVVDDVGESYYVNTDPFDISEL